MDLIKKYLPSARTLFDVLFIIAISIVSYNHGVNSERVAWQQTELKNAQTMNAALSEKMTEFAIKQNAATALMQTIASEQRAAVSSANNLRKEVKNVIQKDDSNCPAFNDDGLRLYRRALGYPD